MSWSPDGNYILYYNHSNNILYKFSTEGKITQALTFKEPYIIKCLNNNCSDYLLGITELSSIFWHALFQSKFNTLRAYHESDSIVNLLHSDDFQSIVENTYWKKKINLVYKNIRKEEARTLASCESCALNPLAWKNNHILYLKNDFNSEFNQIFLTDTLGQTTKQLPVLHGHFSDWSPDEKYLLLKKWQDFSKKTLYLVETSSTQVLQTISVKGRFYCAFFDASSQAIYLVRSERLYRLPLNQKKAKPEVLLKNVTWASISPDRKTLALIQLEKKRFRICSYDPDSGNLKILFQP